MHNLFKDLPEGKEEIFQLLLETPKLRIERIVSNGQASPPDFWYDQSREEWVLLVQGTATLEFETGEVFPMNSGDYRRIPAHCKHRVAAVSQDAIWLTVHY